MGTATLLFLAMTYTTPWDSYLIHQEIWQYNPGKVIGTFLKIPFEEYFFFIIQTIIGCFFTSYLIIKFKSKQNFPMEINGKNLLFLAGAFALLAGAFIFRNTTENYRYLNLVLFWSLPVLILQWSVGISILFKQWIPWVMGVVSLTGYFWFADSIAISKEIWTFPENTISGIDLFETLPIEEALFFLATNLMVVQGYILFTTVDFKRFKFFGKPIGARS